MQPALESAPSIRVLPPEVTARIAAGEVVERPASVIKELVENALDANARTVHVEIAAGGRELLRVSDDGQGMRRADLELSVLQHATSKIVSADDLSALETLGFRGEALPSIAAVSRFAITSHWAQASRDSSAWRIEIAGGLPAKPEAKPARAAPGTLVEVRDLFFNLPARAKFLKGQAVEAAACADCLLRLALTRPDVSFTLSASGQEVFSLLACVPFSSQTPSTRVHSLPLSVYLQRARDVLGTSNSRGLLELDFDSAESAPGYRLFGLVSPPALSRPNRSSIYLTVNGRPVKDRTLTSALVESYRHLLEPKRFPLAALFLELPGSDVDINVHPTKAEVRFRAPGAVYALLHHAIRSVCKPRSLEAPSVSIAISGKSAPASAPKPASLPLGVPTPLNGQRTFDLWNAAQAATPTQVEIPSVSKSPAVFADRVEESAPALARRIPPTPATPDSSAKAVPNDSTNNLPAALPFRILGQAAGSYIVLEDDTGVKLIDQHALHERILFETLLAAAEGNARADSQGLLIPETLELSPVQSAIFNQDENARELLSSLGFQVESFGPRTLAVRAVPAILKSAPGTLVRDVLEALAGSDDFTGAVPRIPSRFNYRERAVYVLSCKGALKAGERLTLEQMHALVLDFRRKLPGSRFTCPHGRPLALELSWQQIQNAVGR